MDNKKAKKLGEVLAFSNVGIDTFEKGREGFNKVWDEAKIDKLIEINKKHAQALEDLIGGLENSDVGMKKAEATGGKLSKMRDMYIGDEWDDPIELFEWFGFFQGAAIVHWSLIEGFGEKENDSDIQDIAAEALDYHKDFFAKVNQSIKESIK